jgi:hypothetical protein
LPGDLDGDGDELGVKYRAGQVCGRGGVVRNIVGGSSGEIMDVLGREG